MQIRKRMSYLKGAITIYDCTAKKLEDWVAATFRLHKQLVYQVSFRRLKPAATDLSGFPIEP